MNTRLLVSGLLAFAIATPAFASEITGTLTAGAPTTATSTLSGTVATSSGGSLTGTVLPGGSGTLTGTVQATSSGGGGGGGGGGAGGGGGGGGGSVLGASTSTPEGSVLGTTSTLPGVPSTGAGGAVAQVLLTLLFSGLTALAGIFYLRYQRS